MSDRRARVRRRIGALAAGAAVLLLAVPHATAADPDAPNAPDATLQLVAQDHVSVAAGAPVTFTVGVPAGTDAAALTDPAGAAEIVVTSYAALEKSQPADSLPLDIRARLQATLNGTLVPPTLHEVHLPTAALTRRADGQLAVTLAIDGDGTTGAALGVEGPGLHPVRLALRVDGRAVGDVLTFVEEVDPAATAVPLATAVAVGTDTPVHLDDSGQVVLDDDAVAALTRLATILETSAMPVTVHVAPALLAALRGTQPALADRFAAVLGKTTILSAPNLPLDPSAAAAADQSALYTQWLAAGEDLFGAADLPGTTLRSVTAVTTALSEPGGELLRNLGTRLLLLTPALYDSLEGNIGGFTDPSQLVRVRLADDRSFDAAVVDRSIGGRLSAPSTQPFLDAVYGTADLLAARQDIISRGLDPARRTVLLGTKDLGLPDPAILAPMTALIASTPALAVSTVNQLGATTDTIVYDGSPLTVDLPATTDASIADRVAVRTDLETRGAQVASMLQPDNPLPAQWRAQLDLLPSPALSDAQVALVAADLSAQYARIRASVEPPRGLDFTMTGRTGTLRLKLRNNAAFPVSVRVRLGAASNKLTFPPETTYVLAPNATTELKFEIKARSNGRFPVYLMLLAPNDTGSPPNPLYFQTRFTASVFALSGLGNLVTGAALLILLSWWVHHIRSSRRRKATEEALTRHPVSAAPPEPAMSVASPGPRQAPRRRTHSRTSSANPVIDGV